MRQESTIIRTKLQPPRVSKTIHREKFETIISQFKDKKLVTVTAGAGYGKTTLVLDAMTQMTSTVVWYRLDTSDADFITFLHYLIAGAQRKYPDFGKEISSHLTHLQNQRPDRTFLLSLFINGLDRIVNEDLFFVLDDFHFVQESQEINVALEFILNHLPDRAHLVLITRKAIDLPMSRLRSTRGVLEIDEKDLRFNDSEIKKLFLVVFDIPINNDHAIVLYEKTKGWISGLILFYHMLKGKSGSDVGEFLENLKGSRGEIYTYLEENIFNQIPLDIQSFLIKTSVLSRLHPDFCDSYLGGTQSKEILKYLKDNHLFTFALDGEKEGYIYHDLLKDFLRVRLNNQHSKEEVRKLYAKAAGV